MRPQRKPQSHSLIRGDQGLWDKLVLKLDGSHVHGVVGQQGRGTGCKSDRTVKGLGNDVWVHGTICYHAAIWWNYAAVSRCNDNLL